MPTAVLCGCAESSPRVCTGERSFPKPVFRGDAIRVGSEVLEARGSKSRPENGIVIFEHRVHNPRDEPVMTCKRGALMLRPPAPPG